MLLSSESETSEEKSNLMLSDINSATGGANHAHSSIRLSLPLVGDVSANGRSNGMFKSICQKVRRCNKKNLEPTIELAVEIAREGREGRRIGTLFTFGDAEAVLEGSRPLILDPLAGHVEEARQIRDPNGNGRPRLCPGPKRQKEPSSWASSFIVPRKSVRRRQTGRGNHSRTVAHGPLSYRSPTRKSVWVTWLC